MLARRWRRRCSIHEHADKPRRPNSDRALAPAGRRKPGAWKGIVRYGDDLADPLPAEVADAFYREER